MRKLIIDAGHGWLTKGKSSIFHKILNGIFKGQPILRENNVNEAIANKLSVLYKNSAFITNEWQDIPLKERVKREKQEHTKDSIFLSIHADAFAKKDTARRGRIFYNSDKGKEIAEFLTKELIKKGYKLGLRNPKQANFYVLKNTKSPAILFELGFMTTKKDLDILMDEKFRNETAIMINQVIKKIAP